MTKTLNAGCQRCAIPVKGGAARFPGTIPTMSLRSILDRVHPKHKLVLTKRLVDFAMFDRSIMQATLRSVRTPDRRACWHAGSGNRYCRQAFTEIAILPNFSYRIHRGSAAISASTATGAAGTSSWSVASGNPCGENRLIDADCRSIICWRTAAVWVKSLATIAAGHQRHQCELRFLLMPIVGCGVFGFV
jgi:hypothetical protein